MVGRVGSPRKFKRMMAVMMIYGRCGNWWFDHEPKWCFSFLFGFYFVVVDRGLSSQSQKRVSRSAPSSSGQSPLLHLNITPDIMNTPTIYHQPPLKATQRRRAGTTEQIHQTSPCACDSATRDRLREVRLPRRGVTSPHLAPVST